LLKLAYHDFQSDTLIILYIITYLETLRKDSFINNLEYPPNFPNYCSGLENHEVSVLHQNPQTGAALHITGSAEGESFCY
jgi:hypothetical protein